MASIDPASGTGPVECFQLSFLNLSVTCKTDHFCPVFKMLRLIPNVRLKTPHSSTMKPNEPTKVKHSKHQARIFFCISLSAFLLWDSSPTHSRVLLVAPKPPTCSPSCSPASRNLLLQPHFDHPTSFETHCWAFTWHGTKAQLSTGIK